MNQEAMPKKGKKLAGMKFGSLSVISYSRTHKRVAMWNCLCECGKSCEKTTNLLTRGKSTSCGCKTSAKKAVSVSATATKKNQAENQWVVEGDCAKADLGDGLVCIIDLSDMELARSLRWFATKNRGKNYAFSTQSAKQFLHCLIMGRKSIDHIDGNGLNNRRSNLRAATASQNQANKAKQKTPTSSRFKGVAKTKAGRWRAEVTCQKVVYRLGTFQTEHEAASAYDAKAKELFGEYAKTNFG